MAKKAKKAKKAKAKKAKKSKKNELWPGWSAQLRPGTRLRVRFWRTAGPRARLFDFGELVAR